MKFDFDLKTLTAFIVSLLLIIVQWATGVYQGGIDGVEYLGLAALLFGPAGLVALVNNTNWNPAAKAIAQHVSAVAIVVVQGIQGVYAGGINAEEWLGLALILVSTLAVYVVPGYSRSSGRVVTRAHG